jgi:hypothetical protein
MSEKSGSRGASFEPPRFRNTSESNLGPAELGNVQDPSLIGGVAE